MLTKNKTIFTASALLLGALFLYQYQNSTKMTSFDNMFLEHPQDLIDSKKINNKKIDVENTIQSQSVHNHGAKDNKDVTSQNSKQLDDYFKSVVLAFPAKNEFGKRTRGHDYYDEILNDSHKLNYLIDILADFKSVERIFGKEQGKARVKILDFLEENHEALHNEIADAIIKIKQDPELYKNTKGRMYDLQDLMASYLMKYETSEVLTNLDDILRKFKYSPVEAREFSVALYYAHPKLIGKASVDKFLNSKLSETYL